MTSATETLTPERVRQIRRWRVIGCSVLFIPWLMILSTPCLVITLAFQREILLTHSDLPGHISKVWVLQERYARGLGFITSSRVTPPDNPDAACVLSDVRFLLWEGDAEKAGALPVHQCACYTRPDRADPDTASTWQPIVMGPEACSMAGEKP